MYTYNEQLSLVQQLLILTVKDGRTNEESNTVKQLYKEVGDEALWQAAVQNKVEAVVAHTLMELSGDLPLPIRWKERHQSAAAKTSLFLQEIDNLSLFLDRRGITVAAIENGGVAYGIFPCPGCFESNDMEILVQHNKTKDIQEYLLSSGYKQTSREGRLSDDKTRADYSQRGWSVYHKTLAGGKEFWINVMWRPVLRRWLPMGREPKVDDLLARSINITIRETKVRILSPEDNVLLCALHTASHSYVRGPGLRLQLDIDRIVRRVSINWDIFIERAKALRVCVSVFPSLAIPRGLLGTPVPDWVLDKLIPSQRRQRMILDWIARASVFDRGGKRFGRHKFLLFESLLCDSGRFFGLLRALFPPSSWMQEGYGFRSKVLLPYYYGVRLADLARRRPV